MDCAMKMMLLTCLAAFTFSTTFACADDAAQSSPKRTVITKPAANAQKEVAVIDTTDGKMEIEFWPDVAPKTVANFIKLAKSGFYNGTLFHRIIKGFMIQGGDPLTKDPSAKASWGTGGPGYSIPAEFNDRHHVFGVISMARSSDPNSAGSQFFLCLGDCPSLDHQYTDFGKLIKGADVLKKIGDTPVTASPSGEMSEPTKEVKVKSIKIIRLLAQ